MHICIPFQSSAQFEPRRCGYIKRFNPALTIVNSTVLPGTTRALAQRSGKPVAYSPVRGKHVRMAQDLLRYVKFVAAAEAETAAAAARHFEDAGMKTRRMGKPETLELAKLAETTYFGVQIAFAQDSTATPAVSAATTMRRSIFSRKSLSCRQPLLSGDYRGTLCDSQYQPAAANPFGAAAGSSTRIQPASALLK